MITEWIKRFIVWYLCKRCNAVFEYNGKVVRVFSKEFYDTEVRGHLNSVARGRFNTRTPEKNANNEP